MKRTKFTGFLVLLVLALVLAACGGEVADQVQEAVEEVAPTLEAAATEVAEEVAEEPTAEGLGGAELLIAVENAYVPFNYIDPDTGDTIGYDYDIFAEICERLNCTPVFVETSWDAMVAVMGGQGDFDAFDIGADGITITEERAQSVDFTDPYIQLTQQMLVRADEDRFTTSEELAADSELLGGSPAGDDELRPDGRDCRRGPHRSLRQLRAGGSGADQRRRGRGHHGQRGRHRLRECQLLTTVKLLDEALTSEELGFILAKGSELTGQVNATLAEMDADGTLDVLFDKWFISAADETGEGLADLEGAELLIAVENAYVPFNFVDPDTGDTIGYDYDIFAEICERLNCTPVFIQTSWDAMVAVMGGQGDFDAFDIGADGITITEERAQSVDFTNPYIQLTQQMLVRADEERFTTSEELAADEEFLGAAQPGTTNYDQTASIVGEDRIVAYDNFGLLVQALINGDVDVVIMDNVAGIGYVNANPEDCEVARRSS